MPNTPRRQQGFTLIELFMTLAVLATLIAAAAPAFGSLASATRAQTSRSALTLALDTARIFAISKGVHVEVCPSADGRYCGRTTEWQHGWIAFIDSDDDGQRDDDERLLDVGQSLSEGVAILSTAGRMHVDYRPDGSATGSNVTLTVCDRRGADAATALVINNAGRVRAGEPSASAAAACEAVLDRTGA